MTDFHTYIDSDWYLARYPDVAEQGLNPIGHYTEHGAVEARWPNRYFDTSWYAKTYLAQTPEVNPLEHYVTKGHTEGASPNAATSPDWLRKRYPDAIEHPNALHFLLYGVAKVDELSPWFSRAFYTSQVPNAADPASSPEHHWLTEGIGGTARPHPAYELVDPKQASRKPEATVSIRHPGGAEVHLRHCGLPSTIANQIYEQSAFEPALLAIGPNAYPHLRQFYADDLATRDLIDYEKLVREFDETDAIIVMPFLGIGGAEKYAACVADELTRIGKRVTILTSESNRFSNSEALQLTALAPLRRCNVVPLWPYLERSWKKANVLALLISALKPESVFVINSSLGLECVQSYGRALSTFCGVYTFFFSYPPIQLGVSYPARYLYDVLPQSVVVADNNNALEEFNAATGNIYSERLVCLRQPVEMPDESQWARLLDARCERHGRRGESTEVLWASRWEPFKATELLLRIAVDHPEMQFNIYGANETVLDTSSTRPENVVFHGHYHDLGDLNLSEFDVFLFTSKFEGLPNIVLEMAARGLPIVASDVGGISEIFSSDAVQLIPMNSAIPELSKKFGAALVSAANQKSSALRRRLSTQRASLAEHCSRDSFSRGLRSLLAMNMGAR